ncbi:hypothetical protein [Corallococcus carmarthensis]|uniref:Uncharacterized protein n=1 Tax=Corallococcus carmarthensis TaxID=2316728 RepID=A0A3A8JZ76_9BACT|nr:hypothetical protein [Corallococcus carmarthensis]RKH01040.1 hypothetical protein D7X32_21640 [Corallococcus carmarthensis]
MSREDNNRYLRSVANNQLRKIPILGRLGPHPFLKLLLFWGVLLALYAGFYVFFSNPSPMSEDGAGSIPAPRFQWEMGKQLLTYVALFFALMGASLGWRQFQAQKARRKEAEALQQPGPEAHLRLTDELLPPTSPFPDVDLLRAQRRALARVLYGQDALARHELNAVNWRGKAPLLQAMERGTDALLHMLCKDDPEQALTLAREALSLADLHPAVPGAKQGRVFYDVLVHSAEVLAGQVTPEGMRTLEHHHEVSSLIVIRLVSAWSLRAASTQVKDAERAERMRQFLQTHAPHCAALHRLPTAEA